MFSGLSKGHRLLSALIKLALNPYCNDTTSIDMWVDESLDSLGKLFPANLIIIIGVVNGKILV